MIKIPTRSETIKRAKGKGKIIAGVFPIHYPRELLKAHNIHPIEIWGPPRMDTVKVRSHLQTYICSVVESGLSFVLSDLIEKVDMILVPHSCDSLQGFGSTLIDLISPQKPIFTFYLPRGKRIEDREFLMKELKNLSEKLSLKFGKRPSESELMEKIVEEEKLEELILKAYKKHFLNGGGGKDFYKIIRSREYLSNEIFTQILEKYLNSQTKQENQLIPIILSGICPEPMDIFKIIEDSGGKVVFDDLATTRRRIYGKGKSKNPYERMSERLLQGVPDFSRGASIDERFNFLLKSLRDNNLRGIIFYNIKFCEPEEFYIPILRRRLKNTGIKSLKIEVDINQPIPTQTITRIKSFFEILEQ